MSGGFRLALSGTPGTGKSTVARILSDGGYAVVSVESLAEQNSLLGEVDPVDGARVIDTDALHDALAPEWESPPDGVVVVDGHLSHHLPCDAVAVLRCSPEILESRLASRGYATEKVQANCEWELLGGAWNEREGDAPWCEFDTSHSSVDSVVASLSYWIADGFKPTSPGSLIDWVARMEG
ncbi:MAG: adenylate kinase family protein [Candidatus Poseidoniales archaeon]|nr:adenylate kinase family protein [Candidatus Poseidoniales archaeon]